MAAHIYHSRREDGSFFRHELRQSSNASVSESRFLKAPAEIRMKIYRYLLVADRGMRLEKSTRAKCLLVCNNDAAEHPGDGVQILRTCRFIYREATAVLYSENKFSYAETSDSLSSIGAGWLTRTGSFNNFNIGFIKSLTLRIATRTCNMPGIEGRVARERAWTTMAFRLAENLPDQLQHITVGRTWPCWRRKNKFYPRDQTISRGSRSRILLLASIITKMHPRIKKAVWLADNGLKYIDEQAFCTNQDIHPHNAIQGTQWQYVDKKDIVFDCGRIRALNRKERNLHDEQDFALPDDALSSELGTENLDELGDSYLEAYKDGYLSRPSLVGDDME
ncbi:uncharacterized protein AB675_7104 [Cyphellophora attinorum]|uniref:DUF7730 domain-containing protein n=1 Tax=Cyphellophora attinorum TaxID=1664694 RepID=A0A0N1HV51_9EURO|nr:uncharacterized protein AB675_7104 [Phialophora attinorum]KPI43514.1 hypothetical protein AB675_7104 [Phialophora attinorum]